MGDRVVNWKFCGNCNRLHCDGKKCRDEDALFAAREERLATRVRVKPSGVRECSLCGRRLDASRQSYPHSLVTSPVCDCELTLPLRELT